MRNKNPLVFAHIGDLHITKAKDQNYIDFLSIISQIETECNSKIDFVILPGDNADQGQADQYKLVATALKMLSIPVHLIAGDHDMEQGNLEGFYSLPAAEHLPKSILVQEVRCLFLDVCGPGKGEPDFHLGNEQLFWLEKELAKSKTGNEEVVIFMHTYPDDLTNKNETAVLNKLIKDNNVALVDMGYTHYNELGNDGNTIFSATRSTGQTEEGPVGHSIITIDNDIVSWRFKHLHDAFPFVMITAPADYRLIRTPEHAVAGWVEVHAIVFELRHIQQVSCKIEDGDRIPMLQIQDSRTWSATIKIPSADFTEFVMLTVETVDKSGRPGQHVIRVATPLYKITMRIKNGSDAASIGAWPENGIFGTQLGPNRNSKPS